MVKKRVIIFTEGGQDIGFGHLTRCSALYDEIDKRGIEVVLVIYGKGIENLLGKKKIYISRLEEFRIFKKFFK